MTATVLETVDQVRDVVAAATAGAFADTTAARQRSPWSMSPSRLGSCTRAGAYAISHTPVSDEPEPEEGRAANLGTWEHEGLLPPLAGQLAARLGIEAVHEAKVELRAGGLVLPGSIDVLAGLVLDVKTVGEHGLHKVRRTGQPFPHHRIQVRGYALARMQAGHLVHWMVWLYVDRASGDFEVIVEAFTNADALAVIDRVTELRMWAENPDQAPRQGISSRRAGPGVSTEYECDRCPWLRRCWGPDAVAGQVGAQRVFAGDEAAVAAALALYDDAAERKSAADRDQDYAKTIIAGTPRGRYGPWALRWSKESPRVDAKAAVARLVELGEPVPMTEGKGHALVRLTERLSKKMIQELDATEGNGPPSPLCADAVMAAPEGPPSL